MALILEGVTHRFGSQTVLDNVSLHVRPGDVYGFLGHNGAGKTTSMRIALGLMRPHQGRVLVDGFDSRQHPLEARARMGALIEAPGFYRNLDGRRNMLLLARLQGIGRRAAGVEVDRLLEIVGLASVGKKAVGSYSQGMRQRLGLAQAILGSPKIVLLDEPMNGLDPEGIREMREMLRRLSHDENMTVLLSSHQLREISDLCNRIAVIRKGRLLVEETTATLLDEEHQRHRLRTSDAKKTRSVLDELGLEHREVDDLAHPDECRLVSMDTVGPANVARRLIESGVDLYELSPQTPSLEEVYVRYTEDGKAAAAAAGDGTASAGKRRADAAPQGKGRADAARPGKAHADTAARLAAAGSTEPEPRMAPGKPVLRMIRHEFARWNSYLAIPFMTCLPALLAVLAIFGRKREADAMASAVEGESLASTTGVTAFEGVAVGLSAGLPLLLLILAGIGSQAIAGGLTRGTLRNILLRPLTRVHVAAGKAASILGLGLVAYGLLASVSVLFSAMFFDFTDVSEILPNGEPFPLVEASELFPELWHVLYAPLLPLAAFAGIGFLAGSLARNGTVALGVAFGAVGFLDLFRVMAREYSFEGWLPSAHLPSPLGDVSFVQYYAEVVQGVSNVAWEYADIGILAPLAWIVVAFVISTVCLQRRAVP